MFVLFCLRRLIGLIAHLRGRSEVGEGRAVVKGMGKVDLGTSPRSDQVFRYVGSWKTKEIEICQPLV